MDLKVVLWLPRDSMPRKEGWKSALGKQNPWALMGITWLANGQLALLTGAGGGRGCSHLPLRVQGDVAQFLLEVGHDFPLGLGGEAVATFCEDS